MEKVKEECGERNRNGKGEEIKDTKVSRRHCDKERSQKKTWGRYNKWIDRGLIDEGGAQDNGV